MRSIIIGLLSISSKRHKKIHFLNFDHIFPKLVSLNLSLSLSLSLSVTLES